MITDVAALALSELGMLRGEGTAYWLAAVHEELLDDEPRLRAFVRHEVQAKVAEAAGCDPELVLVVQFSNVYLRDVLARHQQSTQWLIYDRAEVVPDHLAVIAGIRVPTKEPK